MTQVDGRSRTLPAETLMLLQDERTVYNESNSFRKPSKQVCHFQSRFPSMVEHGVADCNPVRLWQATVPVVACLDDCTGKQGFWGPRSKCLLGTTIPNPLKHSHFVSRLRFYLLRSLRVVVIFAEWDDSGYDGIGSVLVNAGVRERQVLMDVGCARDYSAE